MNFEKWVTERGKHGIRGKSSLSKAARQMIFLRRTISSRLSLPAHPPPTQDDEFLGDFSCFTNSSGIIDEDCPLYMMMNFHLYSYFYPRSPLVLTNVLFCSHMLNCKLNSTNGGTFSNSAEQVILIFFFFRGP